MQELPIPQPGFLFNDSSYEFRDAIVLVVSHSGGTFGSLVPPRSVSNLQPAVCTEVPYVGPCEAPCTRPKSSAMQQQ